MWLEHLITIALILFVIPWLIGVTMFYLSFPLIWIWNCTAAKLLNWLYPPQVTWWPPEKK